MLQQDIPDDYVIATGTQHSVREFVETSARMLGIAIEWSGKGIEEFGVVAEAPDDSMLKKGQRIVSVDPRYFRPAEVDTLWGDATKAKQRLGWSPRIHFEELVREMMASDLDLARRDALVTNAGFSLPSHRE
jgi:GDPmannose 4,6-dehydratase